MEISNQVIMVDKRRNMVRGWPRKRNRYQRKLRR
jgi:hypothetical protein